MNKQKLRELKKIGERGITIQTQDILNALLEDDTAVPPVPTNLSKFFFPKVGEEYWYISNFGFYCDRNDNQIEDIGRIALGVYQSEKEAKKAFEKQEALVRLWKNADEKYYFRADWGNISESKYTIFYKYDTKEFRVTFNSNYTENFSLPHFATREDTENFIKENEKDLEIYRLN